MKTSKYLLYTVLCTFVLALASCEPKALEEKDVFTSEDALAQELASENPEGYDFYTLDGFLDTFMTEEGTYHNDTTPYRERSYDATHGLYLYSIDTIRNNGRGIYIRGRITTDDFSGNFYKAMVIQQIVDGKQQALRISIDLGSVHGLYQIGQEIIIRCNGLAVGRYANQPQLCVPSYNDNTNAMNAAQKVGWCPGRIPGSVFISATKMIGLPDHSKLQYDTLTLSELYEQIPLKPTTDAAGMDKVRKADGRLIVLKDVFFNGKYDNNGSLDFMKAGDPDPGDGEAHSEINVFAPTTGNIGFPQSRLLADQSGKTLMCSNSEYAKFAHFYIPGADSTGVADCVNWKGTVTGILGWYLDKASDMASNKLDGYEWSITPRGIPNFGVADIIMLKDGVKWVPVEYDPKNK